MADPNYDPVKAHEDYLKRRELTPRKPGEKPESSGGSRSSAQAATPRMPAATPVKTAKQLREEAEVRVLALQTKLKKLRALLAQLVKQAKERSGVDTKEATKTDPKTPDPKGTEKLSTQEKAAAAKRSKEYYDKNKKDETPSQQEKSLTEDLAKVQAKIQKIRDELKASVEKARSQVSPPI